MVLKYLKFYLVIFIAGWTLLSCGSKNLEIRGTIHYVTRLGYTCWYIADKRIYYEIITNDQSLLRDGLKVYLYAKPVHKQTICDLPTVLEVISYTLDPEQKVQPTFAPTPESYL